jgi:hypothetical protein
MSEMNGAINCQGLAAKTNAGIGSALRALLSRRLVAFFDIRICVLTLTSGKAY